ncbi:hypothetical protein [Leucobacter sp. NPDC077196]|uniref:hypothetical protein n=1 Tax=Leucobacter sp. NPDC077196 TaxID=3154959 RepID=UPI0034226D6E
MTDDEKRELIDRARETTRCRCVDAPEQDCGQHGDEWSRTMGDLADALEGTLTEPKREEVSKALEYYRKNLGRSVRSNSHKQGGTRPKAANHGARWTPEEDEVLVRGDGLSLLEKAKMLGRSYYATEHRHAYLLNKSVGAVTDDGERANNGD